MIEPYINRLISLYKTKDVEIVPGFQIDNSTEQVFEIKGKTTGKAIPPGDMECFYKVKHLFDAPNIYIIGNAFGFSTLYLAMLFPGSWIDCIDAETEGPDASYGSQLTRELAKNINASIRVHKGVSPHNVPESMNKTTYDVVFIDGKHNNAQIVKDFEAVKPYLAERFIVFFHDVGMCRMASGFNTIKNSNPAYSYIDSLPGSPTGMAVIYQNIDLDRIYNATT